MNLLSFYYTYSCQYSPFVFSQHWLVSYIHTLKKKTFSRLERWPDHNKKSSLNSSLFVKYCKVFFIYEIKNIKSIDRFMTTIEW